jgi:hypothetical protein
MHDTSQDNRAATPPSELEIGSMDAFVISEALKTEHTHVLSHVGSETTPLLDLVGERPATRSEP